MATAARRSLNSTDDVDVVRFYADVDGRDDLDDSMRIDYEILDPTLDDSDVRELIVHVYFVGFTGNAFAKTIRTFDMGRLGGTERRRIAYPMQKASKDVPERPCANPKHTVARPSGW